MSKESPSNGSEFGLGVLLGMGLHIAFVAVCWFLEFLSGYNFTWLVFLIPGIQWLYIYPAIAALRRKEQFGMMQGLLFVAVLTIVLGVIGFLMVMWSWDL